MKKINSKIGAIVVLYNPKDEVIDNIKSIFNVTTNIYVVDNSETINNNVVLFLKEHDIKHYQFNENLGIAYALKYGMQKCIDDNCDWVLTMDQDSNIPNSQYDTLYKLLDENVVSDFGIISFNFNNDLKSDKKIDIVDSWITSGNFVNTANYKKISGFREELFIDYVDFDLNNQFKSIGCKIGVIPNISIKHQIGNPIKIKFLFLKFTCMNHSPIRYYYRFRNAKFLYKESPHIYKKKYIHERYIEYFKVILFEPNKQKKLKMIKKGLKDAKNKKMGKYLK